MQGIKSRLVQIAERKGLSIRAFEELCNLKRGNISNILPGGAIGSDKLAKIFDAVPEINPAWLICGEGSMLKYSDADGISPKLAPSIPYGRSGNNEPGSIPLVSEKAVGGFSNEHFAIKESDVISYYVIPKFRHLGVDFMIEIVGDSMIPRLFPGDVIACSIINNASFIQWNKPHLIATREQGLIVKRLRKSSDKNCFLAVSDNVDYDPFDLPKNEILGIARVVGVIHLE